MESIQYHKELKTENKAGYYSARIIVLVSVVFCLYYTFHKAFFNSFTHDESLSFNNYVHKSFFDIIIYNGAHNPNNHLLNTLLMKLFSIVGGTSEFVLRLPNLLAYLLFILFTYKWLLTFKNNFILALGFSLLHLHPYLLDFFALARGYGLSMSFMFVSFYYYNEYYKTKSNKHLRNSFIAAALAVYSNFTLLNYYFALLGIYNLLLILDNPEWRADYKAGFKQLWKANKIPFYVTLVMIAFITLPLIAINSGLFGPDNGFYDGTLSSVWQCIIVGTDSFLVSFFSLFSVIVVGVLGVCAAYEWRKNDKEQSKSVLIIFLFVFLPAFLTIVQHVLLGSPYLAYRTAMMFIVLFQVAFIFLVFYFYNKWNYKVFAVVIGLPYTLFVIFGFYQHYKLGFYYDWQYDCHTNEMLDILQKDAEQQIKENKKINIGVSWVHEPAVNFYCDTKNLNWLNVSIFEGHHGNYDYYYTWNDTAAIATTSFSVLKSYPEINSAFIKNKQP